MLQTQSGFLQIYLPYYFFCDPEWIRTIDLFIRSELLYPAELRDRKFTL